MANRKQWRTVATFCAVAFLAGSAYADLTTFDSGTEGWSVSGRDTISAIGGNPGYNMDVDVIEVFGAEIRNTTNPAFLGDYTAKGPVRLTVDVRTDSIQYWGMEVTRDLIVELRDNTPSSAGYPYVSVWAHLGTLDSSVPGWQTYSIDILDPLATALPAGWGGYGDEDPDTYEPILPADRTFTDVLASVDELHFTTMVPGWFYGFTDYYISVDNVGFVAIPEPTTCALLSLATLVLGRRR